jgi:hypothetical protein
MLPSGNPNKNLSLDQYRALLRSSGQRPTVSLADKGLPLLDQRLSVLIPADDQGI